jgi:hypothetical protein
MYFIGYLASLSVLYVLKLSDALISGMVRGKICACRVSCAAREW